MMAERAPTLAPMFSDPSRDWSVEILTLAADLLDRHERVTFGRDEAMALRDVLGRLATRAEEPADQVMRAALEEIATETGPLDNTGEPLQVRVAKDLTRRIDIARTALRVVRTRANARGPRLAYSFGLYLGPARITWNCLYPVRGRWNFRLLWVPGIWRSWSISLPTARHFRLAARLRRDALS